jgi:hypothetical protein
MSIISLVADRVLRGDMLFVFWGKNGFLSTLVRYLHKPIFLLTGYTQVNNSLLTRLGYKLLKNKRFFSNYFLLNGWLGEAKGVSIRCCKNGKSDCAEPLCLEKGVIKRVIRHMIIY